jgi:hypothetical protein
MSDWITLRVARRRENGHRLICRENVAAHITLRKPMRAGAEHFLHRLLPIPHRLFIYGYDHMLMIAGPTPLLASVK